MHDLDVLCDRYKDDGITHDVKGKITWKKFNERYNKSEDVVYIQRAIPIEYTEATTPKRKYTSKKLFEI
jgi:hypothetical protein